MTGPNPDKMSWGAEGKTAVEVPTNQSQQRLKALGKPKLQWEEDARTVATPAGANIPAAAFRDGQPQLEPPVSKAAAAVDVPPSSRASDGELEPVFELGRSTDAEGAPAELAGAVVAPELPAPSAADVPTKNVLGIKKRRPTAGRWLLLGLTMSLFYVAAYFAVSVARKLDYHAKTLEPGHGEPPPYRWCAARSSGT